MALFTDSVMVHAPAAGMLAPLKVTLLVLLVSDIFAALQVVAGAGVVSSARFAGNDAVMPDWVNAKPLVLFNVTVSTAVAFAATLAGANAWLMVGAAGVTVLSAIQAEALVPAEDGATLLAPCAVKLTWAVSVLPPESVTTSVSFPVPLDMTFTVEPVAEPTICTAPVLVHAYELIVAPQAAALPLPSSVTLPAMKPGGIFTAAIGFKAAFTALSAFTMPAPQVLVVQVHSALELDVDEH